MTTLAEDMARTANQGKPGFDVFGDPVASAAPSSVGDAQVTANQAAAAKLGITIPGVGGGNALGITGSADVSKDQATKNAMSGAVTTMTGTGGATPPLQTTPMTDYEKANIDLQNKQLDLQNKENQGAQDAATRTFQAIDLSYNASLAGSNAHYDQLRTQLNTQYKTDMQYALEATTAANPYGAAVGGSQSLKNYQDTITQKYNQQSLSLEQQASAAKAQLDAGQYEAYVKTTNDLEASQNQFAKDMFTFKVNLQSQIQQNTQFQQGEQDKAQTAYRLSLTQLPQSKTLSDLPDNIADLNDMQKSVLQNTTAYQQGIAAGFSPQSLLTDIKTSVTSAFKQQTIDQKNQSLAIEATNSQISANKAALDTALKQNQLLDMQIKQGQSGGFTSNPLGNDFYTALNTAQSAGGHSKDDNQNAFTSINQFLQAGDTASAKQTLTNYIFAGEPASTKSIVSGLQDVAGYADSLKAKISALPQTSQPGLLTGNFETLSQKFGQSNDPKLAEIGREMGHLSLIYKSEVFGKRAVVSNDPTLSSLYPSITDSSTLNFATLDAMTATANEVLNGKVKSVIPESTYNTIYGDGGVLKQSTAPSGSTWQGLTIGSVMTNKNDGKLYTITANGPVLK